MKLGNEGINTKFDDIDIRIDFLIELCQSLQNEKKGLLSKIRELEAELKNRLETEGKHAEQETLIDAKIDGLLSKLDGFSAKMTRDELSDN